MGNYISKKKSNDFNGSTTVPLLRFEPEFYNNNMNYEQFKNYIDMLKNEVNTCYENNKNLENTIEKLEKHIQTQDNMYKKNIYNLNEQIDLIKNDLKTLVNNDKCLLRKYNSMVTNKSGYTSYHSNNSQFITNEDIKIEGSSNTFNTNSIMSEYEPDITDNKNDNDDIKNSNIVEDVDYISYSNTNIF